MHASKATKDRHKKRFYIDFGSETKEVASAAEQNEEAEQMCGRQKSDVEVSELPD